MVQKLNHSRTLTFAMHKKETKGNLCTITPKVVEWHRLQPPPMYLRDESASMAYIQMNTEPGWKQQAQQLTY